MPQESKGFMVTLDEWTDRSVINILADAFEHGPDQVVSDAKAEARRAIRAKVLESYRNGQEAGPPKPYKRR